MEVATVVSKVVLHSLEIFVFLVLLFTTRGQWLTVYVHIYVSCLAF